MLIRFRVRDWEPDDLVRRICQLLNGEDWSWWDEHAGKWQLGRANDFWLHPCGDDEYELSLRYGRQDRLDALAVMLEWRLGVSIITVFGWQ
jgi:hypothetical protein